MKYIVLLAFLLSFASNTHSQNLLRVSTSSKVSADTNVNADVDYLYTGLATQSKYLTSVQYLGTKISGTVKGSVALQYCLDTTGIYAGTATWYTSPDSSTLTDITANKKVWPTYGFGKYYRVRITTIDSTQSLRNSGTFFIR